jgi:hypothetical protein
MTVPTIREKLKPFELVVVSLVIAAVTALIVLVISRDLILSSIALGVTFIVCLVVMAMFVLAIKPNKSELLDIQEQNDTPTSQKPKAH